MICLTDLEEPATYQQRLSIARRIKDFSVMDREMTLGEAGTWIRRLKNQTCKCELGTRRAR